MANSPARSAIDVGSVIADTYTIEALIGRGGMGAVFLASHKRLPGKQVAIKVLHTDADDHEVLLRFRREAEIASRLGHPNIVGVSDFNITPEGLPYLVLEYLVGETLAQRLAQGPLPLDQILRITRQVGSALAAAHREGIVHRDLKPQNIFLVPTEVDGRTIEIAKVLDFGISKIRGSQTVQTLDNSLLGTPQYMAPEQATGQHTLVDERTDVFALGAIVYEMLTGHPAFNGASIPEVVFKVVYEQPKVLVEEAPATPRNVVDAVETAMQKGAKDRFATVGAFVEALTGQELPAFKVPAMPPPATGFAGGSRMSKNSKDLARPAGSDDAFANTMGSGDHGPAPVMGVDATMAAPSVKKAADSHRMSLEQMTAPAAERASAAASLAIDATIASSGSGKTPTPIPVSAVGATVATLPPSATANGAAVPAIPATGMPAPPATKRPIVLMVGLAIVCIGAAIVAVVFATRGNSPGTKIDAGTIANTTTATPDATQVATATPDAAPAVAAPIDAAPAPIDAMVAPKVDARAVKPDAGAKVVDPGIPPKPTGGDPEVEDILKRAEATVERSPEDAEQLANSAIAHENVSADQRQHALAIRAKSYCLRYNEEAARDSMRPISKRWRANALELCHRKGQLPNDNP